MGEVIPDATSGRIILGVTYVEPVFGFISGRIILGATYGLGVAVGLAVALAEELLAVVLLLEELLVVLLLEELLVVLLLDELLDVPLEVVALLELLPLVVLVAVLEEPEDLLVLPVVPLEVLLPIFSPDAAAAEGLAVVIGDLEPPADDGPAVAAAFGADVEPPSPVTYSSKPLALGFAVALALAMVWSSEKLYISSDDFITW